MTFSQDCVDLVKASEGCVLHAYQDSAGVWTIGWGHTGKDVMPDSKWTLAQAEAQLAADLQIHCEQMLSHVTVPLKQEQCDALTDFVFNMGVGNFQNSTLLRKLNAGRYSEVAVELGRWVYGGGKILPGLEVRRQKEIALWNKAE